ncbi:MAG: hypothetical protein K6G83_06955 [Lachnospiraceae bacterium]|nr:hypothetical protein [Lachnospiraceae bacterium]
MVNANYYSYVQSFSGYYNVTNGKTGKESEIKGSEGFVQSLGAAYDRAEYTRTNPSESTVDQYIKKHPDREYDVERMVKAGEAVQKENGAQYVDVDSMTMEEYKQHIYVMINKIPFDSSQLRDTQFVDISEKGWEQMKSDPKYEAWVLGYFKIDRAVHNPFAGYPGVEPSIHTEHFGASIEEHIGQSYPQSMATGKEHDSEDWWKKRKKRHDRIMKEAQEQYEKRLEQKKLQEVSHKQHVAPPPIITAEGADSVFKQYAQEEAPMSAAASFFAMIASGGSSGSGGQE